MLTLLFAELKLVLICLPTKSDLTRNNFNLNFRSAKSQMNNDNSSIDEELELSEI